jgi:uncharacterized repeat protein (TIGR01451 family)
MPFDDPTNDTVVVPPLTVEKTDTPDPVYAGDTLTYGVTVANTGEDILRNITVVDTYDSMLTVIATDNGTIYNNTIAWHIPLLHPGDVVAYTVTAEVEHVDIVTEILNTVIAVAETGERGEDNETTGLKPVPPEPLLMIQKTDDVDSVEPTHRFRYTITVANTGSGNATDVVIKDTLPGEIQYEGSSHAPTQIEGSVLIWNIGDLAGGETFTLSVWARADYGLATGKILNNTVNVTCDEGVYDYAWETTNITNKPPVTEKKFHGFVQNESFTTGTGDYVLHHVTNETFITLDAVDLPHTGMSGVNNTWYRIYKWNKNTAKWQMLFNWKLYGSWRTEAPYFPIHLASLGEMYGLSSDGKYQIDFYSNDGAGNYEQPKWNDVYVHLTQLPQASFNYMPASPATTEDIQFTDTSVDEDGSVVSWWWEFGDGSTGRGERVSHRYDDAGCYRVNLTVVDDDGARGTASQMITVSSVGPSASFTDEPASPSTTDLVYFNSTSSDSDGSIVNCTWDLSDGAILYGEHVIHSYADDGSYTVTLTVTDDDGAVDTASHVVSVSNVAPSASFTVAPSDPLTGNVVYFNSTSSDFDGSIVNWTWDLGDGDILYGEHVIHSYADDGSYTVTLKVVDGDGATNTMSQQVAVHAVTPSISFTANESSDELVVVSAPQGLSWSDVYISCSNGTATDIIDMAGTIGEGDVIPVGTTGLFNTITVNLTWMPTSATIGQYVFTRAMSADTSANSLYNLSISMSPSDYGSISLNPSGGIYEEGTVVTATATPMSGCQFDRWGGDVSGGDTSIQVTMHDDMDIVAYFIEEASRPAENMAPTISLGTPAGGSTVSDAVPVEGTAGEVDGTVQYVEVRIDEGSWHTATGTDSWIYMWDTNMVGDGSHTVYVRSYDGEDYSGIVSVTVVVDNVLQGHVPTVVITAPANGTVIAESLLIQGNAGDMDGNDTVTKVEIRMDDGDWMVANGTANWSYSPDLESMSGRTHILQARAYDGTAYSAIKSITCIIDDDGQDNGAPGFEMPLLLAAAFAILMLLKKRKMAM